MDKEEKEKLDESYKILRQAVDKYFLESNPYDALKLIEEALKIYPKALFAYQLKSDILRSQGKVDEALISLESGLRVQTNNYFLLWKRAEILGYFKGRLQDALADIQNAINYFEVTSAYQNAQLENIGDDKQRREFLKNYTSNKIDLKIAQMSLLQLNSAIGLTNNIQGIQKNLEDKIKNNEETIKQERFRSIELLGIFTAILGLIFANVQKATVIKNLTDLIFFDLVLSIPLIIFVWFIHRIFGK